MAFCKKQGLIQTLGRIPVAQSTRSITPRSRSAGRVFRPSSPPTPERLAAKPAAICVWALKEKLKVVVQQAHCLAEQEHELVVNTLAVPLRDMRGDTLAALNLVRSLI